jgi:hypothetical protein
MPKAKLTAEEVAELDRLVMEHHAAMQHVAAVAQIHGLGPRPFVKPTKKLVNCIARSGNFSTPAPSTGWRAAASRVKWGLPRSTSLTMSTIRRCFSTAQPLLSSAASRCWPWLLRSKFRLPDSVRYSLYGLQASERYRS